MKQVRIIVSGRVQGVYFRAHTEEVGRRLMLNGFVRNLPDGNVEVVAQGREKELNELIEFCHNGPPASKVDKVDIKYEEIKERFVGFEVRY